MSDARHPPDGHELDRLFADVEAVRRGLRQSAKTRRLLNAGPMKIAKKVGEEGVEIALAAMAPRHRKAMLVSESADLFYNLCILWSVMDIAPEEVWAELARRRASFGLAEKPGGRGDE